MVSQLWLFRYYMALTIKFDLCSKFVGSWHRSYILNQDEARFLMKSLKKVQFFKLSLILGKKSHYQLQSTISCLALGQDPGIETRDFHFLIFSR